MNFYLAVTILKSMYIHCIASIHPPPPPPPEHFHLFVVVQPGTKMNIIWIIS